METQSSQSEAAKDAETSDRSALRQSLSGFVCDFARLNRRSRWQAFSPTCSEAERGVPHRQHNPERVKHATDFVGGKPLPRVFSHLKPRLESRGNSGPSPSGTAFRRSLLAQCVAERRSCASPSSE